ncbi:hypothetical protein HRbin13_01316 [bacterium HR13]|nr:hypothetical protein HRbin13_01316 [bacterium HR13]
MSQSYILSFELTLPQRIYPYLDRLFNVFKWEVRRTVGEIWNEDFFKRFKGRGSASAILKEILKKPPNIPSRVHRNILELSGEIVRSHIERKRIYDYLMEKPCRVLFDEDRIADELNASPLFVLNVQRQVRKILRKEKDKKSYFQVVKPSFNGEVVIFSADDSVENGQFKKLRFSRRYIEFEIKVPDGNSWKWIKVRKLIPDRLKKFLTEAKRTCAPLIKKVYLKSGLSIYRLVIPLEFETRFSEGSLKVFSLDLSPSEKRLGVGVIVSPEGHSRPIFFNAEKMVKKLERILKEISNLEKKIDNIADEIHITGNREHKVRLEKRLKHLFAEQKLKWRKFKELRKQILEVFTKLILEYARAYDYSFIAVERLKFSRLSDWKNRRMRRLFSQWFYARFIERLRQKALRYGLRVLLINPYRTSRVCHKCGGEGKLEKLEFKCQCGTYDRDYNASVNIGKRALEKLVSGAKSEPYRGEDIPARFPFLQGTIHLKGKALLSILPLTLLLSYLRLVETSYLKLSRLSRYLQTDKYG